MNIIIQILEILLVISIPTALAVGGYAWLDDAVGIVYGIAAGLLLSYIISKFLDDMPNRRESHIGEYKKQAHEAKEQLEIKTVAYNELKYKEISQNDWINKQNELRNIIIAELCDRESIYKWLSPLMADIKIVTKEMNRVSSELVKKERKPWDLTRVNNLISDKRELLEENHFLKYQIEYLRTLIPEIDDIVGYEESTGETTSDDNWKLSKAEYEKLTDTEKNKMALEHYKTRKKRNWEIGRDFERFIGYEYECLGYEVEYFGIEKRLEDLGRDLIAKKDRETLIVQCKYWSRGKTIHEKHIAQLYGTVVMYELGQPNNLLPEIIRGIFVTHTTLSDEAKRFARHLKVEIMENKEQGEYPLIKCNVNKNNETGEVTRIYHLPIDQQYDTTKINKGKGDCYAFTVEEAEGKGFRRAYRWHGE